MNYKKKVQMAMQTSDEALEKYPEREKKQRVLAIDREPSKVGMGKFQENEWTVRSCLAKREGVEILKRDTPMWILRTHRNAER